MPMFDDPNKELSRLQEELLAEESNDDLEGLDELLKDYEPTILEDCFQEKAAKDETFNRPNAPKKLKEVMSEALQNEEENETPLQPKKKGIAGLVTLCVLETVAIVGLLAWWFLCLR